MVIHYVLNTFILIILPYSTLHLTALASSWRENKCDWQPGYSWNAWLYLYPIIYPNKNSIYFRHIMVYDANDISILLIMLVLEKNNRYFRLVSLEHSITIVNDDPQISVIQYFHHFVI